MPASTYGPSAFSNNLGRREKALLTSHGPRGGGALSVVVEPFALETDAQLSAPKGVDGRPWEALDLKTQGLAEAMAAARHVVVLTGAGVSTESGLPDYRSSAGLWQDEDLVQLASLTALRKRPLEFFRFYQKRLAVMRQAKPNPAHYALATLQRAGAVKALITQNIDGLHSVAGAPDVIEAHGNLREAVCLHCHQRFQSELIMHEMHSLADLPECPACGGLLKPGVVLFEEPLPAVAIDRAVRESEQSDLFVVVGSSLEVGPVNLLPKMAVEAGARLAIINLSPTHLDDLATWVIPEKAGEALPALAAALGLDS